MLKAKKIFSVLLVVILIVGMIGGCTSSKTGTDSAATSPGGAGNSAAATTAPKSNEKFTFSIAANPIGQSSYQQAAALSDLITRKNTNMTVSAEETSGYMENIKLITNGEVEIAFSNNMMLADGYYARAEFNGYKKNMALGVMALAPNMTHIIVPEDSSIKSIKDIKGKKVGMGQPGGSSLIDAQNLIKAAGMTEKDFTSLQIKGAEQTEMMKNNQLDVYIWNGKIPVTTIVDLVTTKKVKFLELEKDIIDGVIKINDCYGQYTIPANTYKGQDKDIKTFGNQTVLIANAKVPDEIVYRSVKTIMENLDSLIQVSSSFKEITKENLLKGITVPLHPGALKYYEEINLPGLKEFKAKYQK